MKVKMWRYMPSSNIYPSLMVMVVRMMLFMKMMVMLSLPDVHPRNVVFWATGRVWTPRHGYQVLLYNQTYIIWYIGNIIMLIPAAAIKCCSIIKLPIFVGTRHALIFLFRFILFQQGYLKDTLHRSSELALKCFLIRNRQVCCVLGSILTSIFRVGPCTG